MANIYWIVSYPKSGNTWVRCLLSMLCGTGNPENPLSGLDEHMEAMSKGYLSRYYDIEISDLKPEEVLRIQRGLYEDWSNIGKRDRYLKIHNSYYYLSDGKPLYAPSITTGTIYLVRNPLDIVGSLANHLGCSIDKAIDFINDPNGMLFGKTHKYFTQSKQFLRDWSGHVSSWLERGDMNVGFVRYEDLVRHDGQILFGIANHVGIEARANNITSALNACSFDSLREMEKVYGFREKAQSTTKFFRWGKVGLWKRELNSEQKNRVIMQHDEWMKKLGYLDKSGSPVENILPVTHEDRLSSKWILG